MDMLMEHYKVMQVSGKKASMHVKMQPGVTRAHRGPYERHLLKYFYYFISCTHLPCLLSWILCQCMGRQQAMEAQASTPTTQEMVARGWL